MEAVLNVEEIMAKPEAQEAQQKLVAAFEQDEAASKVIDEADSVESLYDAMKGFLNLTLEKFRKLIGDCYDYCAKKMEIADEDLDIVAGGGLGSWLKSAKSAVKKYAVATCAIVGAVGGAVVGGVVGAAQGAAAGPVGMVVGAVFGGLLGAGTGYGFGTLAGSAIEASLS